MSTQPFTHDAKPLPSGLHIQGQYCRLETVEVKNPESEPIVTNEREVKSSSSLIASQLDGELSSTLHTDVPFCHETGPLHSPPQQAQVIAREAETAFACDAEAAAVRGAKAAAQSAEATAIRQAHSAARNAKVTAIRQAHAAAARERARQRAREEEAAKTMTRVILGSIVTYSAGLDIPHLITGFETCTLHVKNLPLNVREDEVLALFIQQRIDSQRFHVVSVKKGSGEKFEAQIIVAADTGRALAEKLDGLEFKDEMLAVEVSANSTPEGMNVSANQRSETLTILWRAPSVHYVVRFSDMAAANDKVRQLDRRVCAGRRVRVEINTPPPDHSIRGFRTNSIKISHLPHSITDEEIMAFTGSSSVKRLASDVTQAVRTLRDDIERVVPNALKRFDPPSGSPRLDGVVYARAHFSSWDEAHAARTSLSGKYSRNQSMWFRLPDPMHFTMTIPLEQYTAQKAQWDVLLSSVKERKACILDVYNAGNIVHFHLAGSIKEAIGAIKVRVESLARGGRAEALKYFVAPPLEDNNYHSLRDSSESSQTCSICKEDVTSLYQLGCEHIYCVACLSHYIWSSLESAQLPLTCPGDETRCHVPLPIPTIQHFLPPASFDRLLEAAFDSYVSKHPEEFKFCRTPECSQIYRSVRPGESPKSLHCPSCFATVCNACDQDTHERPTCAESKLHRDQERLNEVWITSQQGRVKRCPRCNVIIEKVEGCNMMLCRCGADICWQCMRIYSHCTCSDSDSD